MLEEIELVCDAPDCDRVLGEPAFRLALTTPVGTRRVYECTCGAVTITVSRE